MERIYNLLSSFLGESKQGGYIKGVDEYQFDCPSCAEDNGGVPDGKHNLEVHLSVSDGIGLVYHCWKCQETKKTSGILYGLIRRYGGKERLARYREIIKDIKENCYVDLKDIEKTLLPIDAPVIKLPDTFRLITEGCPDDVWQYMQSRNLGIEEAKKYNLGYTTGAEEKWQMQDRLIVPSYDISGELNYWSGRDITGNPKKTKYRNSDGDKLDIVFNEHMIQWDADIYLCEGIIDSLCYDNAVPLMGKKLSKESYLYKRLNEKANGHIIICLDADTTIGETKSIYKLLNQGRLRDKIEYIRIGDETQYKDFGEAYQAGGKRAMVDILGRKRKFSELELQF